MATIVERRSADGTRTWQAKIRRRGAPSIARTFDLKADAEAWAREIERDLQRGNLAALRQDALRVTVSDVITRYKVDALPKLRSKSAAAYVEAVGKKFGRLFLGHIRGVDVADWRDDLLKSGLSPQSVLHHLHTLSAIFRFAEQDLSIELPAGNPARKISKPERPKSRERRLRPGEYEALLAAATTTVGLREIVILAVETSMRLGELLALRWADVDLTRRTAHLPTTKNGDSRTVALSSTAVEALQALPRRMDGRVFTWKRADSFESIWRRMRVRARKAHVLSRLKAELCAQMTEADADSEIRAMVYRKREPRPSTCALHDRIIKTEPFLEDLRFHDLRHESISRLFEKGLGIMDVSSMSGHKTLSMLKRYTHIEAAKLAQKLG
ncbi:MAG: integrase [Thiomonas sp. 13-66-29]|jgi:integrase|nr:MAG: integrase [Thiomonas sp. 13-66-29]